MVREGLKNSGLSPAQGSAGKINGVKPLILEQAANRDCGAASADKAMDGFYQGFPEVSCSLFS